MLQSECVKKSLIIVVIDEKNKVKYYFLENKPNVLDNIYKMNNQIIQHTDLSGEALRSFAKRGEALAKTGSLAI